MLRRGPKEVLADGGVEVFNVEANEAGALMVLCRFEPVNYRCGVFPLVEVGIIPHEWATTKQACRDESVVYLFLSSTNIYFALH